MSDPVTVTFVGAICGWTPGELLKAVISNWLAGTTQRPLDNTLKGIWNALQTRVGSIPQNHDLLKASRQALASSVLVLQQSLDYFRETNPCSPNERHWIDVLQGIAKRLATQVDEDDLPARTAKDLARFDTLMVPD
jgi:hypothetical protein